MEDRKDLYIRNDLHSDNQASIQDVHQSEGWCSAEFSSGCILEDE